jgi:hypothetical protein
LGQLRSPARCFHPKSNETVCLGIVVVVVAAAAFTAIVFHSNAMPAPARIILAAGGSPEFHQPMIILLLLCLSDDEMIYSFHQHEKCVKTGFFWIFFVNFLWTVFMLWLEYLSTKLVFK